MQDLIHERIEFHTRLNPSAIAFHEGGRDIRYGRFRADINAVAAHLVTGAGLGKGDRVLVAVAAPYLEWLVVLACARLGITTVSVNNTADMALPGATACISDVRQPDLPAGIRRIEASRDWIPSKLPMKTTWRASCCRRVPRGVRR
jgi:acyl-CoA synthetase (AMP-forming)/AMP-acid ligase II